MAMYQMPFLLLHDIPTNQIETRAVVLPEGEGERGKQQGTSEGLRQDLLPCSP